MRGLTYKFVAVEYRHLRFFLAVSEELHFTRAAARLGVAQPHLSHEIRGLEQELGVELFARTRRRVELTPAGETFRRHAQSIVDATGEAFRAAQRTARGEAGKLVIGFVSAAAYGVLPLALRRFRAELPDVELVLVEGNSDEGLQAARSGGLDVCLLHPPRGAPAGMEMETLVHEPLVAALPDTHPLAKKRSIALRSLASEPWIFWPRELASRVHDDIVAACIAVGFEPRVAQRTMRMGTVISLVSSGLGVALVPQALTRLHLEGVAYRPLASPSVQVPLAWIRNQGEQSAALKRFLFTLRAAAREWALPPTRVTTRP